MPPTAVRHRSVLGSLLLASCCLTVAAQGHEFDFYSTYRSWSRSLPREVRSSPEVVLEQYRQKLGSEGVAPTEVERRIALIRTRRDDLEADFWNRFFTSPPSSYNREPNAFLVSVVEGRKPGRALDVGMGEGRNALYLAKLGWEVTGFDPADKAVALARERAQGLGLKLNAIVAHDRDFDFGHERWDLILFSWTLPTQTAARVVDALKPGGIVVVEGGRSAYPMNGLLEMFRRLRVLHFSDSSGQADFARGKEMDIVRFCAEKIAAQ